MNALIGSPINLVYGDSFGNIQDRAAATVKPKKKEEENKQSEEQIEKQIEKQIEENPDKLARQSEKQIKTDKMSRETNTVPGIDNPLFRYKGTDFFTNENCLQHLIKLVKELLLMVKVIMFVLVLLFLIKIMERKN
tara:strand:+ start:129 stop:536 length:408 start_codon:yes stop_codon:yes gene_type:complete